MWKWTSENYFSLINLHEQVTPSALNPFIFFFYKTKYLKAKVNVIFLYRNGQVKSFHSNQYP